MFDPDRSLDRNRSRRHDRIRMVLLPPALVVASVVLLVLTGFGQDPPDRLAPAALVAFGALFGDAFARSFARLGHASIAWIAAGALAALAPALALDAGRDLLPVGVAIALGAALQLVPERRARLFGPAAVFVAATVLANYTLDAFLPVGPWLLVNVGTLFFGVTFTQRDRIHRFGRPAVYATIVAAGVANVAAALAVGTPLRYVAVSFLAIVASEAADTEVYQRLLSRRWLTRVLSSNAVSAPLDTVLFTVLAFFGAPWATFAWMTQVIVTDVIVKYGSGLVTALLLVGGRDRDAGNGTMRSRTPPGRSSPAGGPEAGQADIASRQRAATAST